MTAWSTIQKNKNKTKTKTKHEIILTNPAKMHRTTLAKNSCTETNVHLAVTYEQLENSITADAVHVLTGDNGDRLEGPKNTKRSQCR